MVVTTDPRDGPDTAVFKFISKQTGLTMFQGTHHQYKLWRDYIDDLERKAQSAEVTEPVIVTSGDDVVEVSDDLVRGPASAEFLSEMNAGSVEFLGDEDADGDDGVFCLG